MRKLFLSFFLILLSISLVKGQKKDTVPTMVPKRITQKAPEPVLGIKEQEEQDSIASIPPRDSSSFGFHFGLQISGLIHADRGSFSDLNFKSSSKSGYNFGLYYNLPINHQLYFQPELNYSEKGFIANSSPGKFRRTYSYLELPLLIKYYAGKNLFFTAGPEFSYLIQVNDFYYTGSTVESFYVYNRQEVNLRKIEAGINIGAGFKAGNHLSFVATYGFDLTTNYNFIGQDAPRFQNGYFNIRFGYRLSKDARFTIKR